MKNKHIGSSVKSFFEELGEWDEVKKLAEKKKQETKESKLYRNALKQNMSRNSK